MTIGVAVQSPCPMSPCWSATLPGPRLHPAVPSKTRSRFSDQSPNSPRTLPWSLWPVATAVCLPGPHSISSPAAPRPGVLQLPLLLVPISECVLGSVESRARFSPAHLSHSAPSSTFQICAEFSHLLPFVQCSLSVRIDHF